MELELTVNNSIIRNRNRIEIQKIYPSMLKDDLVINHKNSVLGVSIHAPASEGNKMLSICQFLNNRGLTSINIFIGDGLYRYTAMIKYGCNEQAGRERGEQECQRLQSLYSTFIKQNIPSLNQLNFFLSSEIEKHEDFKSIHNKILNLFKTHHDFRLSVLNFANYYFSRAFESNFQLDTKINSIEYACQYLLEELAIFAILNQSGFNVFIYPGHIQTLYDIIAMEEPYLKRLFYNYKLVSLRIKRV